MCNSLGLAQRPAHLSAAQSCSCVVRVVVEQPRAVASGVLAQSRQTLIIPQRPQQVTTRAATLLQSLKTFSITHSLRQAGGRGREREREIDANLKATEIELHAGGVVYILRFNALFSISLSLALTSERLYHYRCAVSLAW